MTCTAKAKISLVSGLILFCQVHHSMAGSGCHLVSQSKMSWFDALVACQTIGFCLASIEKNYIWLQLIKQLKKERIQDDIWTGLNAYEKHTFTYAENNEYIQFLAPRSQLSPDKPCVYLSSNVQGSVLLTANCEQKKKFICAKAEYCNARKTEVNITALFNPARTVCALVNSRKPELLGEHNGLVLTSSQIQNGIDTDAITVSEKRAMSMIYTWKKLQDESKN